MHVTSDVTRIAIAGASSEEYWSWSLKCRFQRCSTRSTQEKKQGPRILNVYTHTHAAVGGCCSVVWTTHAFGMVEGGGCIWLAIVRERNGDRARRGRTACGYHCRVKRPCVHQLDLSTDQPCSLWYKRYTTRPACVNGHTQPKRFTRNLKKRRF